MGQRFMGLSVSAKFQSLRVKCQVQNTKIAKY